MDKKVRVRFAPSPTGPLHIGGVRTALYNYLFAKKHGGDFILRIEDTDTARTVPGAEAYIIEALTWAGIKPNEGILTSSIQNNVGVDTINPAYKQSIRNEKGIYKNYVDKLISEGKAYYAFDSKEDLDDMREKLRKAGMKTSSYDVSTRETMKNSLTMSSDEVKAKLDSGAPYVVRIKMPRGETIKFTDLIRGTINVYSNTVDDKVLFKSDGMPTYHLANVVDDYLMGITHVIRGEEWLPSAPLHVMLYKYLDFKDEMPAFAHLPLIMGPSGKLSKRDGDSLGFPVFPLNWTDPATGEVSSGYRERGFLPEAFVNMIALLGWNPGNNVEVMSMDEMISSFTLERINKSGAKFDLKKAEWMAKTYLTKTDNLKIARLWIPMIKKEIGENPILDNHHYVGLVAGLLKEKVTYIDKFWDNGKYFFVEPDPVPVANMDVFNKKIMLDLVKNPTYTHDEAKAIFDAAVIASEVDARAAGAYLRMALTGMRVGPPIFDIISVIGNTKCLSRLEKCAELHQASA